jgi:hypothetical protein
MALTRARSIRGFTLLPHRQILARARGSAFVGRLGIIES